MSLADTRAAIVARLAAVPGIGVVHAYERFAADQKKFRDLYTGAPGLLQGWFVCLGGAREVSAVVGLATQVAGWRLQGFRAIDDDGASGRGHGRLQADAGADAGGQQRRNRHHAVVAVAIHFHGRQET